MMRMARSLATSGGEVKRRAAVGRAYYAVLVAARIAFDQPLEQDFRVHRKLPEWIASHFDGDDASRMIEEIRRLYSARIWADYNLLTSLNADWVSSSIEQASGLVDRLAAWSEEGE